MVHLNGPTGVFEMQLSVTEAKARLTDLVRRAEAGEEVTLTRRGQPTVRLVPVLTDTVRAKRRKALEEFQGILKGKPGWEDVTAANVADYLYDENGLPV
jgi:prevent-host-death family protein